MTAPQETPLPADLLDKWPNCTTPDCENKVCLWSGVPHCYPCSERLLGKPYLRAAFIATGGDDVGFSDEPGKL